jgi:hypothetical protein
VILEDLEGSGLCVLPLINYIFDMSTEKFLYQIYIFRSKIILCYFSGGRFLTIRNFANIHKYCHEFAKYYSFFFASGIISGVKLRL